MEIYISSAIPRLLHKAKLDFEKTFDIISAFLVQAHWLCQQSYGEAALTRKYVETGEECHFFIL